MKLQIWTKLFIATGFAVLLASCSDLPKKTGDQGASIDDESTDIAGTSENIDRGMGVKETSRLNPINGVAYGQWKNILFDYDSATIKAEDRAVLEDVAKWMKENPSQKVLIAGNCDERGTLEYNRALGQRRANAARDYLIHSGASPARVGTVSWGEERPIDPGHDDEAWSKNRRDEIGIVQ